MTADLTTRYLGLELCSPLVASAAPHNADPETAIQLERAGVGAIVLPSLFEEEITAEEVGLSDALDQGTEAFHEATSYFPAIDAFVGAGDRYLASIERLKTRVSVPVIASLNAATAGGWVRYARQIEDAGADALELNLYHVAADPTRSAAEMEAVDLEVIGAVRSAVTMPVAVKLSPYYSSLANFARSVSQTGVDGLVLFNRFYQPDLDLETGDVVARLQLSESPELRLPLRWIAILRPQLGPAVSLALSSGVRTGADAVKALMVGADVVMMTSALLRSGPGHARTVEAGLLAWLAEHEYVSVDQLRGRSTAARVVDPTAFERANYMTVLRSWTTPPELTSAAPGPALD